MLGVPGSLLPASHPLDLLPSPFFVSSTSSIVVNLSFLLVEALVVSLSLPVSWPTLLVWRVGVRIEGNGFVLVTGDVGTLRGRPSESGILAQSAYGHSTVECDTGGIGCKSQGRGVVSVIQVAVLE